MRRPIKKVKAVFQCCSARQSGKFSSFSANAGGNRGTVHIVIALQAAKQTHAG
jgi:hypothetical protein